MPNRQYKIKMYGTGIISLRNRTFLRKIHPYIVPEAVNAPPLEPVQVLLMVSNLLLIW